jgi:hypothetical protein
MEMTMKKISLSVLALGATLAFAGAAQAERSFPPTKSVVATTSSFVSTSTATLSGGKAYGGVIDTRRGR